MFKKTLIALGLLGTTMLSGCVVYSTPAPRAVVYGPAPAVVYEPAPAVVVGPVVPVFGFYGGYYHGYYGYHRGWR
jgi:hypothetical protein